MIYFLDGVEITHTQFSKDSISYPHNWCHLVTSNERNSIGIIPLTEVFPTLSEGEFYDGTYIDDFIELTRTYNTATT